MHLQYRQLHVKQCSSSDYNTNILVLFLYIVSCMQCSQLIVNVDVKVLLHYDSVQIDVALHT